MSWKNESRRHSLSAKGISTKQQIRQQNEYDYEQGIKDMFKQGGPGYGKSHYDEDWFRYTPDGEVDSHELCSSCNEDGTCDFHPKGCDCSYGACQEAYKEMEELKYPRIIEITNYHELPIDIREELLHEYERGLKFGLDHDKALINATEHVSDNWDEELDEDGREIGLETYFTMQRYIMKQVDKPLFESHGHIVSQKARERYISLKRLYKRGRLPIHLEKEYEWLNIAIRG